MHMSLSRDFYYDTKQEYYAVLFSQVLNIRDIFAAI